MVITQRLDLRSLKSLCHVSRHYRFLAQPLVFREFKGIFYERDFWTRLQLLGDALFERSCLGQAIHVIKIRGGDHLNVARLAHLLRPILSKTPRLSTIEIPGDTGILQVLFSIPLPNLKSFRNYRPRDLLENYKLSCFQPILLARSLSAIHLTNCWHIDALETQRELPFQHITFECSYLD